MKKTNNKIKLFEDFLKEFEISLEREVQVTFRFLLKEGVKSETLLRKIEDKFIQEVKPPFEYEDFIFYEFQIDFISDIPLRNKRIESEYAIKAKVKFDENSNLNSKEMDRVLRDGITKFLKLEEDEHFSDEIEESIIVSYEYLNL
jgi:hypothetical protein